MKEISTAPDGEAFQRQLSNYTSSRFLCTQASDVLSIGESAKRKNRLSGFTLRSENYLSYRRSLGDRLRPHVRVFPLSHARFLTPSLPPELAAKIDGPGAPLAAVLDDPSCLRCYRTQVPALVD
jgi:hypothetical protein